VRAACILALLAASPAAADAPGSGASPPAPRAPFAVVELFTSEGCSSCPPADRLLSGISHDAARDGRNILTLEFHVDYWNTPSWTDTLSDALHSERQRRYASALGSEVYTPQAVVNGRAACVGSDAAQLRRLIAAELGRPARATLSIESVREGGHPALRYRMTGAPAAAWLCVAITESNLISHVRGGENAGRVLEHDSVVREFFARPLGSQPTGLVRFAAAANAGHPRRLVAFVQDPRTLEILAAASAQP
jgi:hypothetical protein